jgi:hypothetical protein
MRLSILAILIAFIPLAGNAGRLEAAIIINSQTRFLDVMATGGSATDQKHLDAVGFGLFDQSLSAHAENTIPPPFPTNAFVDANASQISEIQPGHIFAQGSASVAGIPGGVNATAESFFAIAFSIVGHPQQLDFITDVAGSFSNVFLRDLTRDITIPGGPTLHPGMEFDVGDYELHGLVNCPLFGETGFGGTYTIDLRWNAVPEPSSMLIWSLLGIVAVMQWRRCRT